MKAVTPLPPAPVSSGGLRRFLYGTAAFCGGAIMIVEILGAKMLAPYLGTSHFVWTAQIAVTMMALAAGYYAGGRIADRRPSLAPLYLILLGAAVYLAAVTLALRPVAAHCLEYPLAVGSLLASTLLFFVPLALLAMTGPFLVRVMTQSVTGVGGSMGRLTAVSTLGSFAGTALIGYAIIPFLPNSVTLLLTAGGLAGLSLAYFVFWGYAAVPPGPALGMVLLGVGTGALGWRADQAMPGGQVRQLHRSNSNFGELQVLELGQGGPRYYLNDLLIQNTYDPASRRGVSTFTYMLHDLAQAYTPRIDRALCIGMGVGLVPAELARSGVQVDIAEINPAVVEVARRYFDCPVESLHIAIADGRQWVNQTTNRYDAIILDAFLGDSSPSHLMSREAFAAMRQLLGPEGTLVINCFADFRPGHDFFGASLDKTLRSVFRSVRIHGTGSGNVYFVASERQSLHILRQPDFERIHPQVRGQAEAAFNTLLQADPGRGRVLTDDFNPVEFYDAANREEIRRNLARSMGLWTRG